MGGDKTLNLTRKSNGAPVLQRRDDLQDRFRRLHVFHEHQLTTLMGGYRVLPPSRCVLHLCRESIPCQLSFPALCWSFLALAGLAAAPVSFRLYRVFSPLPCLSASPVCFASAGSCRLCRVLSPLPCVPCSPSIPCAPCVPCVSFEYSESERCKCTYPLFTPCCVAVWVAC